MEVALIYYYYYLIKKKEKITLVNYFNNKLANFYKTFAKELEDCGKEVVDVDGCYPTSEDVRTNLLLIRPMWSTLKQDNEQYFKELATSGNKAKVVAVYDGMDKARKLLFWRYVTCFIDIMTESINQ
jgi:hypothetical protein